MSQLSGIACRTPLTRKETVAIEISDECKIWVKLHYKPRENKAIKRHMKLLFLLLNKRKYLWIDHILQITVFLDGDTLNNPKL